MFKADFDNSGWFVVDTLTGMRVTQRPMTRAEAEAAAEHLNVQEGEG